RLDGTFDPGAIPAGRGEDQPPHHWHPMLAPNQETPSDPPHFALCRGRRDGRGQPPHWVQAKRPEACEQKEGTRGAASAAASPGKARRRARGFRAAGNRKARGSGGRRRGPFLVLTAASVARKPPRFASPSPVKLPRIGARANRPSGLSFQAGKRGSRTSRAL